MRSTAHLDAEPFAGPPSPPPAKVLAGDDNAGTSNETCPCCPPSVHIIRSCSLNGLCPVAIWALVMVIFCCRKP